MSPMHQGPADLPSRLAMAAAKARVLVVGALNVDTLLHTDVFPEPDSAVVVRAMHRCPGGHAGNSSAGLVALGASVRIISAVGSDADGELLVEDLNRAGVDTSRIERTSTKLTGQVFIPSTRGKHYMLLARGANDALSTQLAKEIADFRPTALVLFDPPREVLMQVATLRTRCNALPEVYWCPGPINSHAADLAASLIPHVDVLLVNEVERRALGSALDVGFKLEVVTTHGSRGAEVEVGQQRTFAKARCVKVIDTVGSGDAFLAAYLIARDADTSMAERLTVANAYGALAARRAGARAGLVSARALLQFIHDEADSADAVARPVGVSDDGAQT